MTWARAYPNPADYTGEFDTLIDAIAAALAQVRGAPTTQGDGDGLAT